MLHASPYNVGKKNENLYTCMDKKSDTLVILS